MRYSMVNFYVTTIELRKRVFAISEKMLDRGHKYVYGIPKNGTICCKHLSPRLIEVDDPMRADCFLDDLIDSGATADKWIKKYNKPFYVIFDKLKKNSELKHRWIIFPWEVVDGINIDIVDNILRLKQYIGTSKQKKEEIKNLLKENYLI